MKKILIAGLGNPGAKYEMTRHNAGFLAVEKLIGHLKDQLGIDVQMTLDKKSNCLLADFEFEKNKVYLAMPQTFMNLSGQAIGKIATFYQIDPENILVVHDEIDLPFGSLRLSKNSSSAGHRGVESIIQSIGNEFSRLRIGVNNEEKTIHNIPTENFVLNKFTPEEMEKIPEILKTSAEKVFDFIRTDSMIEK